MPLTRSAAKAVEHAGDDAAASSASDSGRQSTSSLSNGQDRQSGGSEPSDIPLPLSPSKPRATLGEITGNGTLSKPPAEAVATSDLLPLSLRGGACSTKKGLTDEAQQEFSAQVNKWDSTYYRKKQSISPVEVPKHKRSRGTRKGQSVAEVQQVLEDYRAGENVGATLAFSQEIGTDDSFPFIFGGTPDDSSSDDGNDGPPDAPPDVHDAPSDVHDAPPLAPPDFSSRHYHQHFPLLGGGGGQDVGDQDVAGQDMGQGGADSGLSNAGGPSGGKGPSPDDAAFDDSKPTQHTVEPVDPKEPGSLDDSQESDGYRGILIDMFDDFWRNRGTSTHTVDSRKRMPVQSNETKENNPPTEKAAHKFVLRPKELQLELKPLESGDSKENAPPSEDASQHLMIHGKELDSKDNTLQSSDTKKKNPLGENTSHQIIVHGKELGSRYKPSKQSRSMLIRASPSVALLVSMYDEPNVESIRTKSPLSDSLAALDTLEENIEAFEASIHSLSPVSAVSNEKVSSPEPEQKQMKASKKAAQKPRAEDVKPVRKSVARPSNGPRQAVPQSKSAASSPSKAEPVTKTQNTPKAAIASLRTPPSRVKSTKPPTKSSFVLPGEAKAAELKARREEREKRREELASSVSKAGTLRRPANGTARPSLLKATGSGTIRGARPSLPNQPRLREAVQAKAIKTSSPPKAASPVASPTLANSESESSVDASVAEAPAKIMISLGKIKALARMKGSPDKVTVAPAPVNPIVPQYAAQDVKTLRERILAGKGKATDVRTLREMLLAGKGNVTIEPEDLYYRRVEPAKPTAARSSFGTFKKAKVRESVSKQEAKPAARRTLTISDLKSLAASTKVTVPAAPRPRPRPSIAVATTITSQMRIQAAQQARLAADIKGREAVKAWEMASKSKVAAPKPK